MQKFFDRQNNRLVFVGEKSGPIFWDEHWDISDFNEQITSTGKHNFVVSLTGKYLHSEDGPILEGGCGIGQNVYALMKNGFSCVGIDYSQRTVAKINKFVPELDVGYGDVRKLEFEDGYFAGYWSLGVIEHFWNGYNEILLEMKRVLQPGGYLFLTFPYLSPLRILKAKSGCYPLFNTTIPDEFYQFAFDHKVVIKEFEELGFNLKYKKAIGGIKGCKDEIALVRNGFQKLYGYKGRSIFLRGLRFFLNKILALFAGHMMLLVLISEKRK